MAWRWMSIISLILYLTICKWLTGKQQKILNVHNCMKQSSLRWCLGELRRSLNRRASTVYDCRDWVLRWQLAYEGTVFVKSIVWLNTKLTGKNSRVEGNFSFLIPSREESAYWKISPILTASRLMAVVTLVRSMLSVSGRLYFDLLLFRYSMNMLYIHRSGRSFYWTYHTLHDAVAWEDWPRLLLSVILVP